MDVDDSRVVVKLVGLLVVDVVDGVVDIKVGTIDDGGTIPVDFENKLLVLTVGIELPATVEAAV